jgi:hypothetical protein
MSDLVHEVMTPESFSSIAPIHAFIVDSRSRIRDRASLVGRVYIDRTTGEAFHKIVDLPPDREPEPRPGHGPGDGLRAVLRAALRHDGGRSQLSSSMSR